VRTFLSNHSLTLTMAVFGTAMVVWAWQHEPGPAFDTWLGMGQGMLTVALFYAAANFFRETAKPED
jgi:hypothetical protein